MSKLRFAFGCVAFISMLALGCSKSAPPAPQPVAVEVEAPPTSPVPPSRKSDVPVLAKKLRTMNPTGQREAAEALAALADKDTDAIPALVEALNDTANRGAGKVLPTDPSSVREAAAIGLVAAGPSAQKSISEQAVPRLIAGLNDTNPAVREHTARAISQLGELAKAAETPLWKLAADSDGNVRTAAHDALRRIGPTSGDPVAALLVNADAGIRGDAATAVRSLGNFTAKSVPDLTKALGDTDALVRAAACDGLANVGPSSAPAVPKLVELLALTTEQDLMRPDPLELAPLRALTAIGEPAVAVLRKATESTNPLVRIQAVFVLGEIGPPAKAALPELEKSLRDPIGGIALEAARSVARVSGDAARAADLMKLALTNEDPTVRFAGMRVALRMGTTGSGLTGLVTPLLADPEPDVRRLAVEFAGTIPPASAKTMVPAIAKQLSEDKEEAVRRRAVEVLMELGPVAAGAAEALGTAAIKDESFPVRTLAVEALGELGPDGKAGVTGLGALAKNADAEPELRSAALLAIARIAPFDATANAAIQQALTDRHADIRTSAARAAAKLDTPTSTLLTALGGVAKSDPNQLTKLAALRAIAQLGPKAKSLRATVESLSTAPQPDVALWAKVAIPRIDGKPADGLNAVRTSWNTRSNTLRLTAIEAIPLVQPAPEDVAKLGTFFTDRNSIIRVAAVNSTGECGKLAAPLVPKLVELLRDNDGDVRTAAAIALGQIGDTSRTVRDALREVIRTDPLASRPARKSLRQLSASNE